MISEKSKELAEACYIAKDIVDFFRSFAEGRELNTTPIGIIPGKWKQVAAVTRKEAITQIQKYWKSMPIRNSWQTVVWNIILIYRCLLGILED